MVGWIISSCFCGNHSWLFFLSGSWTISSFLVWSRITSIHLRRPKLDRLSVVINLTVSRITRWWLWVRSILSQISCYWMITPTHTADVSQHTKPRLETIKSWFFCCLLQWETRRWGWRVSPSVKCLCPPSSFLLSHSVMLLHNSPAHKQDVMSGVSAMETEEVS